MFQTQFVQNVKTHLIFDNIFPKIMLFVRWWHALCMLDN